MYFTWGNKVERSHSRHLECDNCRTCSPDTSEPRSKKSLPRHLFVSRRPNWEANHISRTWHQPARRDQANFPHWNESPCWVRAQLATTQTRRTCAGMFLYAQKRKINDTERVRNGNWKLPMMLNGNFPMPQNCPIMGAFSSRPSWMASQSKGQCSAPDPISFIGQEMRFSHLLDRIEEYSNYKIKVKQKVLCFNSPWISRRDLLLLFTKAFLCLKVLLSVTFSSSFYHPFNRSNNRRIEDLEMREWRILNWAKQKELRRKIYRSVWSCFHRHGKNILLVVSKDFREHFK